MDCPNLTAHALFVCVHCSSKEWLDIGYPESCVGSKGDRIHAWKKNWIWSSKYTTEITANSESPWDMNDYSLWGNGIYTCILLELSKAKEWAETCFDLTQYAHSCLPMQTQPLTEIKQPSLQYFPFLKKRKVGWFLTSRWICFQHQFFIFMLWNSSVLKFLRHVTNKGKWQSLLPSCIILGKK